MCFQGSGPILSCIYCGNLRTLDTAFWSGRTLQRSAQTRKKKEINCGNAEGWNAAAHAPDEPEYRNENYRCDFPFLKSDSDQESPGDSAGYDPCHVRQSSERRVTFPILWVGRQHAFFSQSVDQTWSCSKLMASLARNKYGKLSTGCYSQPVCQVPQESRRQQPPPLHSSY